MYSLPFSHIRTNLLIHQIRSERVFRPTRNICARMDEVSVLEDEHSARLGFNMELALQIVRMESCRSPTVGVLVEVEVQGVEGDFIAVGGHVGTIHVGCVVIGRV